MKLYGYWRSSAAYRVRIAMNLKGVDVEQLSVHLVKDGGEQHTAAFKQLNPQSLVPTLAFDNQGGQGQLLSQSLAIIEYLDERYPEPPLLPDSIAGRAQVRAMAHVIAADIHPLNNLRVLQYLSAQFQVDEQQKHAWYRHWVVTGFEALEMNLSSSAGTYCYHDQVTLADLCLVPQVYNAQRFGIDLTPYKLIRRINASCLQLPSFIEASPERQADAT